MIQLGVSLYPEQETLKDVEAYLAMASAYGFTKVFTSMFSVKGTREEVVGYFKEFTKIAHKYNMKVSGDCNSEFFERMGGICPRLRTWALTLSAWISASTISVMPC